MSDSMTARIRSGFHCIARKWHQRRPDKARPMASPHEDAGPRLSRSHGMKHSEAQETNGHEATQESLHVRRDGTHSR